MALQVRYAPLADLAPHDRNPKAHDVEAISRSVRRFGFIEPVVIDERTGLLASGHGRLSALTAMRDAGEDPPTGIRRRAGDWLVPRVEGYASADDAEAAAVLIALNRTGELGGWADDALLDLLSSLSESDTVALDDVGFDLDEIDRLRASLDDLTAEPEEEPDRLGGLDYDEWLRRYAGRTVRALVLNYPRPVYDWLAEILDGLREPDETNPQTVARIVAAAANVEVPDYEAGE